MADERKWMQHLKIEKGSLHKALGNPGGAKDSC